MWKRKRKSRRKTVKTLRVRRLPLGLFRFCTCFALLLALWVLVTQLSSVADAGPVPDKLKPTDPYALIFGTVWGPDFPIVTVRDCLERIERITGRTGLIEYGKRSYSENEIFRYEPKVQGTYAAFDWKPSVTLDQGLQQTWEFFRDKV